MDVKACHEKLKELLKLDVAPVAIAFKKEIPPKVPHVTSLEPAGCSYWKLAAEGHLFYTQAEDHYSCPIGAFTNGVELPKEKQKEMEGLIQTMVDLKYIKMEELPTIPHRKEKFTFAIYAPLSQTPCEPDVVLIRGNGRQCMLLTEAAEASGVNSQRAAMGRPTCAVIPEAIQSGKTAVSFACVGNRVYTEAKDGESYFAIPWQKLPVILDNLATIVHANEELEKFHQTRLNSVKVKV